MMGAESDSMTTDDLPPLPECSGLAGYTDNQMHAYARAAVAAAAPAQPADCGEAGHADGRCGNAGCLPSAQPAEPVAWEMRIGHGIGLRSDKPPEHLMPYWRPLYATAQAPAPQPLTDSALLDIADNFRSQYLHGGTTFDEFDALGFARAVLAAQEQKP